MASSGESANSGGDGKDDDELPPWTVAFLHATYFGHCSLHDDSHRHHRRMFCTDCMGEPYCLQCAKTDHEGHTIIRVRRCISRQVVNAREIERFIDVSGIQTYMINNAEVVYLKKGPPLMNPVNLANNANTCVFCSKNLFIPFQFCSIGCKYGVMKVEDLNLPHKSDETQDSTPGTPSDVSSWPEQFQTTQHSDSPTIGVPVPDQEAEDDPGPPRSDDTATPSSKPVFDHSNSRKRKGTPWRAPVRSDNITEK